MSRVLIQFVQFNTLTYSCKYMAKIRRFCMKKLVVLHFHYRTVLTISSKPWTSVSSGQARTSAHQADVRLSCTLYTGSLWLSRLLTSVGFQMRMLFTAARNICSFQQRISCDSDIFELCTIVSVELHLEHPRDPFRAVDIIGNFGMLCKNPVLRLENTLDYGIPHLQRKSCRSGLMKRSLITTVDFLSQMSAIWLRSSRAQEIISWAWIILRARNIWFREHGIILCAQNNRFRAHEIYDFVSTKWFHAHEIYYFVLTNCRSKLLLRRPFTDLRMIPTRQFKDYPSVWSNCEPFTFSVYQTVALATTVLPKQENASCKMSEMKSCARSDFVCIICIISCSRNVLFVSSKCYRVHEMYDFVSTKSFRVHENYYFVLTKWFRAHEIPFQIIVAMSL